MALDKDMGQTFLILGFVDIWGPELRLGLSQSFVKTGQSYTEMNQELGQEIHEDGLRGTKRGHIQLQLSTAICDVMPFCYP